MARLVLSEIAKRLNLNTVTFNRWIKQGKIPVKKVGNFGIFNEAELNAWAAKQRIPFRNSEHEISEKQNKEREISSFSLLNAVKAGGVLKDIEGICKEDAIQCAVNRIKQLPNNLKSELYMQIMKREKLTSTGIGNGIAIPHPRSPLKHELLLHPMIVTCFLDKPIDFNAIDGKAVFVFFLILTPSIEIHLNLLSKLSFCLRDTSFINFLKTRPDPDDFIVKIKTIEKNIEERGL